MIQTERFCRGINRLSCMGFRRVVHTYMQGATFPVVNSAQGSDVKLQTFAFRLKAAGELDHFIEAINIHKTIQTEVPPPPPYHT
jgi:hypothetical protein